MKFSLAALALPAFASAAVHTVQVGSGGLSFSPSSITAAVGDTIQFKFAGSGHAIAQGAFGNGCQPFSTNPFWTGASIAQGKTWTITVKNTTPTAFYCSTPGHCEAGMVGVINPSGKKSLAAYKKSASSASGTKSPSKVQGGTFS